VWAYDVGLRARYELALDTAPVSAVSWAPAGNRIAYLRRDPTTTSLRMRSLTGAAATTTLTTGEISPPVWLPDSTHLVLAAVLEQLPQPVGRARPRVPLRQEAPAAAHLLGQLGILEEAADSLGVFSRIVTGDQVTAHLIADDGAQAAHV